MPLEIGKAKIHEREIPPYKVKIDNLRQPGHIIEPTAQIISTCQTPNLILVNLPTIENPKAAAVLSRKGFVLIKKGPNSRFYL